MRLVVALSLILNLSSNAAAQSRHDGVRTLLSIRVSERIELDGRLDEQSWSGVTPSNGFRQIDPDEGKPSTEETDLRILFDDSALYVGVRLFDREPGKIVRRLARRDTFPDADRFTLYLDPHHDHLTGAMFEVSAGNVQRDAIISNDTFTDNSWDSVWESAVSLNEEGWCIEMRIPFSQLRFPQADRHTWGVNAARFIHRRNETAWLELVPKKENGLASRMAHLSGIDGIEPGGNLEIVPYVVLRPEFIAPSSPGNPFSDGAQLFSGAGFDLKYGLTSNFTLNATVNPDFGQVEVDPAVVNLSAFETFFQEKRPFFLEGAQIFTNFGRGGANSFWAFNRNEPALFYSRRIGRTPQGRASGDFVERPDATTILGAAKLTGRTKGGWTLGLIEAVTGRESARIANGGARGKTEVEPLTNYVIARIQREVGRRAGFGILTTGVNRDLRLPALRDLLPDQAYVTGGDAYFFFDDRREWVLNGNFSGSTVRGSAAAIDRLQRAPQRYYQRPDAPHVRLRPGATSLKGWSGSVNLNRNSGSLWTVNAALWGSSPGFESNDLGLHFSGDVWGGHAVLSLRKLQPDRWTRFRNVSIAKWWTVNFANQRTGDGFNMFANATLLNYWFVNGGFGLRTQTLDDRLTRGGPVAANPAGGFSFLNFGTDGRRNVSVFMFANYGWSDAGNWNANGNATVNLKPLASLTVSTGPGISRSRNVAQYIRSVTDPTAQATFGSRHVFADIDQTEISMVTRVNWILTPKVSLQIFAQPLVAVGDYRTPKEFTTPRGYEFLRYGESGSHLGYSPADRRYTIDPDGSGPASSFTLNDPDFNFKSLRLNAVFRWEWRLGSTVYFVWTQNRSDLSNPGQLSAARDIRRVFTAPADDVFLVKLAYWFGR